MTTLNELNAQVTSAILRAERLSLGARESQIAYGEVARLELELTRLLPADAPGGVVARAGVVSALIAAGRVTEALQWAETFSEGASAPLQMRLERLKVLACRRG